MTRQEANKEIINNILKAIDKYPDMRFHQLLFALRLNEGTDLFYEESADTLKKLEERNGN